MADQPKPQLARLADAMKDQPAPADPATLAAEANEATKPPSARPGETPHHGEKSEMKANNTQANDGISDRDERLVQVGRGQQTTGRL